MLVIAIGLATQAIRLDQVTTTLMIECNSHREGTCSTLQSMLHQDRDLIPQPTKTPIKDPTSSHHIARMITLTITDETISKLITSKREDTTPQLTTTMLTTD